MMENFKGQKSKVKSQKPEALIVLCLLLNFAFFYFPAFSQDLHFSQFYATPLNLNPANTGLFDGDFRFVANHRTQWASVSAPYKSTSGSFDAHILGNSLKAGTLCGGIVFNSDKAGDSQWGLMQAAGSLSFTLKLDEGKNFVTVGAQGGFGQRSINYDKLIFDEQYDGDAYNPNLSTGESLSDNSYTYPDFSGGVNWNFSSGKGFASNLGAAGFHLNEPVQASFNNGNSRKLDPKMVLHANIRFKLFGYTDMIPAVMFEKQNSFREFLFGTNFRFGFEPKSGFSNAIYLGMQYRRKDAYVVIAGMEFNNLNVGVSYDINSSSLRPASNSRGGFELSLIYIIKKVPPLSGPKKPCPIFL